MSLVIHLNGLPGTGKRTIALELAKLFNARVLDNHTMLNPAAAVHGWGSDEFYVTAQAIRDAVLPAVEKDLSDVPVVVTNGLYGEVPQHRKIFADFRDMAGRVSAPFFPVLLTCAKQENIRRLQSADRSAMKKPTDPAVLEKYAFNCTPIRPAFSDTLDVTDLSPADAALAIANMVQDRLRKDTGIPDLKVF